MATNVTKKGKLKNIDVENNTETLMHPETSSDVVLIENVDNSAIPSNVDNLTELVNEMGSAAYASTNDFSPPIVVTPTFPIPTTNPFPTTNNVEIGKITVGSTTKTLYSPGVFTPPWRNNYNAPQAGSMGLVPAPGPHQENSFLRGDGTWDTIIESGTFTPSALLNAEETIMDSYTKDGTTFKTNAWYWRTGKLVYIRMYIVFNGKSDDSGKTYSVGSVITGLPYYTGNASSPFEADTSAGRLFVSAYTASHLVGGFNLQAWILENRIYIASSRVGKIGNDYSQLGYNNIDNYLYRLDTTGDDQDNTVPFFNTQHPTIHISGVFPIKDADA